MNRTSYGANIKLTLYGVSYMIPNMDLIIMDTNVLLSAFLSKRGASHLLLSLIETGVFKHAVSTALVLEYEDVLLRNRAKIGLGIEEIRTVINNFEPRVSLIDVQTIPDFDNGAFDVNIIYRVVGADIPAQQLEFVLQPTR